MQRHRPKTIDGYRELSAVMPKIVESLPEA